MASRKRGMPKVTPNLSKSALGKTEHIPMTKSGFCQFGPGAAHNFCVTKTCDCACHTTPKPTDQN